MYYTRSKDEITRLLAVIRHVIIERKKITNRRAEKPNRCNTGSSLR